MSVGFTMDVLGFEAVKRNLRALPRTWMGKIVRPALREGAKIVLAATIANAQQHIASGRMVAHFRIVGSSSRKRRGTIKMSVMSGTREELNLTGNNKTGKPHGYYPSTIEFGTKDGKYPPYGFMKRALESTRAAVMAKIEAEITAKINGRDLIGLGPNDFDSEVLATS